MPGDGGLTELRRGVLGPCVLALLEVRPRFGLELVRDLAAEDGLLTSDGTVYPLLNRLRDAGLVTSEWHDAEGQRARRYYSITEAGLGGRCGVPRRLGAVLRDRGKRAQPLRGPGGRRGEGTPAMSGTALEHPLIRGYLRELDAALAGSPVEQARELREQITAHLEDVLPAGAGEQEVAAALARLGSPASLAAEARAGRPAPSPAARATRRMLAALSRQTWRFWSIAVATVILVGFPAGYTTAVLTAGALQPGPAEGWWYVRDATHDVMTSTVGGLQETAAVRPGQRQGLFFMIYNPSDETQTVLGPADRWEQSLGSTFAQFGVSARGAGPDGSPVYARNARYSLPGDIPPHQSRALRVLWTSDDCMQKGSETFMDRVILRVRIGWTVRNETVLLNEVWALAGTAQSDCSGAPWLATAGLSRPPECELAEAAGHRQSPRWASATCSRRP